MNSDKHYTRRRNDITVFSINLINKTFDKTKPEKTEW